MDESESTREKTVKDLSLLRSDPRILSHKWACAFEWKLIIGARTPFVSSELFWSCF